MVILPQRHLQNTHKFVPKVNKNNIAPLPAVLLNEQTDSADSPCSICSEEENGRVTSVDAEMKYESVKWG